MISPGLTCITKHFLYFCKQFLVIHKKVIERKIMRRLKGPFMKFFFFFLVQELVVDRFTE